MMEILFTILMFVVFGRILILALSLGWGIVKVLLTLIFLPVILLGAFAFGLIRLAFPLLLVVGIVSLIASSERSIM